MNDADGGPDPLFLAHGSPMNAIADNCFTAFLSTCAKGIPKPRAIVVISAHWQTRGSFITGSAAPPQLHDFYGFPDELYALRYAPPGSPAIAGLIHEAIGEIGIDPERGMDHAAWALARRMYPAADVPLLELSLDAGRSPRGHFELGRRLRALKGRGILFIGSGNLVHNLRDLSFDDDAAPFPWALAADAWLKDRLERGMIDELIDYTESFPGYRRSIPTDEHYLPLLYILGMHDETRPIKTLYEEIQNGSISMRCAGAAMGGA